MRKYAVRKTNSLFIKKCLKSVAIMMYKVKTGTAPEYIKELYLTGITL